MRDRVRVYTSQLPIIGNKELKQLVEVLEDGVYNYFYLGGVGKLTIACNEGTFTCHLNGRYFPLSLDKTKLTFGERWWYLCPACDRRVGILYAIGESLACRCCHGLHYRSQSEDGEERMRRKIWKKRVALWGVEYPEIFNLTIFVSDYPKPPGVSWQRYRTALNELITLEGKYWDLQVTFLPTQQI
ncbi:hypothetical protein [Edaphovirga cremea]|uniref:hypothetical protein n=1 Tax=Edaphovirga cremea TaxID=2267246 RepID=UPI00398A1F17